MNLKRVMLMGNFLLSGLVIWAGVSIVFTWASHAPVENSALSEPSKMPVLKNHTTSKDKQLEDYTLIVSNDVFHTTKVTAPTAEKKRIEDINETELNLQLKGTVVGEGKDSYAFILDEESGIEAVYCVNDYVMGAQILRIMNDRVFLNVSGRRETLLMVSLHQKEAPAALKRPPSQWVTPPQRRTMKPRRFGGTGGS